MSVDELVDEDFDHEQHERELIEDLAQRKQQEDARQQQLLEAAEAGEEWAEAEYEWIEVGECDVQVRCWAEGEIMKRMADFQQAQQSDTLPDMRAVMDTEIDTLVQQTNAIEVPGREITVTADGEIRTFWENIFDRWGDRALEDLITRVFKPVAEAREARQEAVRSFPKR